MENSQTKQFSIIIRFSEFNALNGELAKLNNDVNIENFVKQFFLQKYGEGVGKLEVVTKKSKAKLKWLPPKLDSRAEGFHKVALMQAKNKNYVEAVNNWIKAISVNSTDPDYYFNLGIAFFEIKNYKESVENLKKAISVCPIYYKAYLILGTVYLKIRQFEQAELYLIESIRFCPEHSLAYLNLGAVYSILKRYDDGIKMFLRTIELAPKEVRAYFGIGKIYSIKGDVVNANHYFKKVIELDEKGQLSNHAKRAMFSVTPNIVNHVEDNTTELETKDFENLYQDGYRAYLFTDYDKSILMYTGYLKNKPDDDFVWFSLGEAYLRIGEILKAAEAFKKAIDINSSKALYYKELAVSLNYLQKDYEVIESLKKAHKLGKSDSITYSLLGKFYLKQQNYNEAISNLLQSLKLNSNNLFAKFHLALAYEQSKDRNSAAKYLQEIVRTPVNSPLKMKSEAILNKIKG